MRHFRGEMCGDIETKSNGLNRCKIPLTKTTFLMLFFLCIMVFQTAMYRLKGHQSHDEQRQRYSQNGVSLDLDFHKTKV